MNHDAAGDPCNKCGKPAAWHLGARPVSAAGKAATKRWRKTHPKPKTRDRIIGIDGEGQGRDPHIYNYIAAADENGKVWDFGSDPNRRIRTEEFLDFILELPLGALIFAFAFQYDLTKGLQDVADKELYLLFHTERRRLLINRGTPKVRMVYRPVYWPSEEAFKAGTGYSLNYMNRKFTVQKGKRSATVWDIFAFFQSKFTKALVDWQIGKKEDIEEMERMKAQRSDFDAQAFWEIKQYCQTECKHLASLGRQLLKAHDDAQIPLTQFFGAGSTGKALLKKYDVARFIDNDVPEEMREAIACAFFGGRFENSVIGPIIREVDNADINSAYPYAATGLPCLIHGRWRKCQSEKGLEKAIGNARLALIRWRLPKLSLSAGSLDKLLSWGPLPVRKLDGTIAFPLAASCGWTWKEEFLAARKMRPDVTASFAWLYDTDCNCKPFNFLPEVYLERLRIGEDARGIVLKLGPNSVYGALVQSIGWRPPFQCWIWGGNITSSCRAQLLEAMSRAPDLSNVLMLATDGLWSDLSIPFVGPKNTGTTRAREISNGRKGALGEWDIKRYKQGVFAARPGIYFPLNPTEEEIGKVRARGLGRRVLYEQHRLVMQAYQRGESSVILGARSCDVASRKEQGSQRFVGAKTGMSWYPSKGVQRSEHYGQWLDWPTEVSFDPRPKRCEVREGGKLTCWGDPTREKEVCRKLGIDKSGYYFDAPSVPYDSALKSEEDLLMMLSADIGEEQPNADFVEVD